MPTVNRNENKIKLNEGRKACTARNLNFISQKNETTSHVEAIRREKNGLKHKESNKRHFKNRDV